MSCDLVKFSPDKLDTSANQIFLFQIEHQNIALINGLIS